MTVPVAAAALGEGAAIAEGAAGTSAAVEGGTAAKKAAPALKKTATARPAKAPATPAKAPKAPAAKKTAARPATREPRGTGGRSKGFSLAAGGGGGSGAHRIVVAEFVLCVVLIGTTPIVMRAPDKDGKLYAPNDFVRLSAVSLLFFVLALMSNTPRLSRAAAAFGGLVTLGVLYNASHSIAALGAIFSTAGKTKGAVPTAAAGTETITTASYHPVDITGDPSAPTTPAAGGQSGIPT